MVLLLKMEGKAQSSGKNDTKGCFCLSCRQQELADPSLRSSKEGREAQLLFACVAAAAAAVRTFQKK